MRFLPIFAISIASALAIPLANPIAYAKGVVSRRATDVFPRVASPEPDVASAFALIETLSNELKKAGVSPTEVLAKANLPPLHRRNSVPLPANIDAVVLGFINAALGVDADVQAAVANIGIDYSTLLSNIGNNNVVFVRQLPEIVDIVALVNAIADAIVAVGANVDAVIANIDIDNSSILTDILNGDTIIARRNGVPLPANIDAVLLAFINALINAGVNVQAALANIGIDQSTLLSNIGNGNVIFVRQLPEVVDILALVNALANAAVAAGVNVNAVIANLNIDNSSILTNILNGNTIILRRNSVALPANIDAIVLALINAAVAAGANVQVALANIGIDQSTLLSNIGNNNVVFIRGLPEIVDIVALVNAVANALVAVGANVDAVIANINIDNSSILTDILNGDTIIARRNGVPLPANIDAVLLAFINALINAGVNVQAALANIGIDQSTLLSNIGNGNVIFVRQLPEVVDILALVNALANAAVAAGVNVNAVIANLNIDNSSILTNILNGNTIILRRNGVPLPANIDTILLAFINAAIAAGVNVQAALANIGIDQSTLLSNIGNGNVIFVRQLPEIVDIAAVVNAIANAAAAAGVNVDALIANINIQNSSILTDILNGNTIILRRNSVVLPANIDAIVLALINALVALGVNVQTALANINIDQSTLLSNIGNNNVIFVRQLIPEVVDLAAVLNALANAAAAVGVNINTVIANLNIDNSNILTDILNGDTITA
ncbi:hypothetical protein Clacol_000400 [Clathrus columnatus]|uniref:Uncharacterized protein n=1 Tax=Clathrus columnatus TaxID=1419009 RepID=A0AAV4ZWH3_9AGAM|nr:hypothetical protein Clacol_000400 [Clathrus columnatus]